MLFYAQSIKPSTRNARPETPQDPGLHVPNLQRPASSGRLRPDTMRLCQMLVGSARGLGSKFGCGLCKKVASCKTWGILGWERVCNRPASLTKGAVGRQRRSLPRWEKALQALSQPKKRPRPSIAPSAMLMLVRTSKASEAHCRLALNLNCLLG